MGERSALCGEKFFLAEVYAVLWVYMRQTNSGCEEED